MHACMYVTKAYGYYTFTYTYYTYELVVILE